MSVEVCEHGSMGDVSMNVCEHGSMGHVNMEVCEQGTGVNMRYGVCKCRGREKIETLAVCSASHSTW